jgi:hypothetical protein
MTDVSGLEFEKYGNPILYIEESVMVYHLKALIRKFSNS